MMMDIKLNNEVHNYSTRSANKFHVDPYQTNFGKFGVLREAVHCFNTLEPNIQQSPNLDTFKNRIHDYLLAKQINNEVT